MVIFNALSKGIYKKQYNKQRTPQMNPFRFSVSGDAGNENNNNNKEDPIRCTFNDFSSFFEESC